MWPHFCEGNSAEQPAWPPCLLMVIVAMETIRQADYTETRCPAIPARVEGCFVIEWHWHSPCCTHCHQSIKESSFQTCHVIYALGWLAGPGAVAMTGATTTTWPVGGPQWIAACHSPYMGMHALLTTNSVHQSVKCCCCPQTNMASFTRFRRPRLRRMNAFAPTLC